jgi:NTP pyrophosphatase (non-canonical NTP hydrolase)
MSKTVNLPTLPRDFPKRGDAFSHWKDGDIYVVVGSSRSEADPGEFDVLYLPEGASADEIPWRRPYGNFTGYVPAAEVHERSTVKRTGGSPVRRFEPVGRRELQDQSPQPFLRPEVAEFARAMEEKLRKHEGKGGWKGEDPFDLIARIVDETDELDLAVQEHQKNGTDETATKVLSEAADVANFCLFVTDVLGGFGKGLRVWP